MVQMLSDCKVQKYIGLSFSKGANPLTLLERGSWDNRWGSFRPTDGITAVPMPCCGQTIRYESIYDIPTETTPCPCGADWSWVVKYQEEA